MKPTPRTPPGHQLGLVFDGEAAQKRRAQEVAANFAAAVRAYGGPDSLRAALGKPEDYYNKILDGMNGVRPVQGTWRDELLTDPRSAMILLTFDSERAGFEPPVCHREVSEEDIARAARDILAESGHQRDMYRAEIAKRLGVRPEQVKL